MKMHKYNRDKEFDSSNHIIYFRQGYSNPFIFIHKKEGSFIIQDVEVRCTNFSLSKIVNKYRIEFVIYFKDKQLRKGTDDEE